MRMGWADRDGPGRNLQADVIKMIKMIKNIIIIIITNVEPHP